MRPRLLRVRYFAWTIIPAILFLGYQAWGLPHMIWSYDFYGSYDDWSSRHYTRCTFIGPYGAFTTYPDDGKCAWLAFFKRKDAGQ